MENKNNMQMIYLKDLLFAAMYRWRSILAAALILAFLLGGVKTVFGLSALNGNPAIDTSEDQTALQIYEIRKASIDQQILLLEKRIQSQQTYLSNSVLMQIDPFGFYEAHLTVYVDTNYQISPGMAYQNPDKTASVINGYQSALSGNQILQPLADATGIQPQYISELITMTAPINTNILVISVKYPDAAGAQKFVDLIAENLESIHAQIEQAIVPHEVRIVAQSAQPRVDATLEITQKTELDSMTTLINALKDAQDRQAALTAPGYEPPTPSNIVKDVIIYFVIGAILGVFLAVLVFIFVHIASDKVYSARTLRNRTGIKVLGCVNSTLQKNPLDRWLRKLEGRNTSDIQSQSSLLAVNIRNRCVQAKHLLVISEADASAKAPIVQALRETLSGVQVDDCGSLLQDKSALEALAICDSVLLVAQCNHSQYANLKQEMAIISDCGKQLVGCVLLGG